MKGKIKWHQVVTLMPDGSLIDVSKTNIINGQMFLDGVEQLLSGKIEITEQNYNMLNDKSNFHSVWQTNLYGIWIDGYMFNDHKKIRLIYREN